MFLNAGVKAIRRVRLFLKQQRSFKLEFLPGAFNEVDGDFLGLKELRVLSSSFVITSSILNTYSLKNGRVGNCEHELCLAQRISIAKAWY